MRPTLTTFMPLAKPSGWQPPPRQVTPPSFQPGMSARVNPPAARAQPLRRPFAPVRRLSGLADAAVPSTAPAIPDTGMRGFLKWVRREYPADVYQQIATQIQQRFPQAFSSYMLGGWRKFARLGALGDGSSTVDTADAANSTPSDATWSAEISQMIGTATGAFLNVSQQENQNAIVQAQLQQAAAGKNPLNVSLGSSGITFGSTAGLTAGGLLLIAGIGLLIAKAAKVI